MEKIGCVFFHQGWTDIIVCLPLINYYSEIYDKIYILMRDGSKNLIDFYIKNFNNVFVIYFNFNIVYNPEFNIDTNFNNNYILVDNNIIRIPENYDILFHYHFDIYRKDKYKNINKIKNIQVSSFQEAFYKYYDIDFSTRINKFEFTRNLELENSVYENFINQYSNKYILYHDDENNTRNGNFYVNTKINFDIKKSDFNYVNLNLKSNTFFDYIKVLINSAEMHLIDSVWGALIFQLDAKYGLFGHIPIYLYPLRNHHNIFNNSKLNNWTIK